MAEALPIATVVAVIGKANFARDADGNVRSLESLVTAPRRRYCHHGLW